MKLTTEPRIRSPLVPPAASTGIYDGQTAPDNPAHQPPPGSAGDARNAAEEDRTALPVTTETAPDASTHSAGNMSETECDPPASSTTESDAEADSPRQPVASNSNGGRSQSEKKQSNGNRRTANRSSRGSRKSEPNVTVDKQQPTGS